MLTSDHTAAALKLAAVGKPVFPCHPDNKRPFVDGGFKAATTDAEQISAWWGKWPDAMIGMPTGPASGVWGLDVDAPKDGESGDGRASLAELTAKHGPLPSTRTHATPSGGQHFLFKYPSGREVRNSASKIAPLLDVRGDGGYIIMPPSINAQGVPYAVTDQSKAADAPEWLLDLVAPLPRPAQEPRRSVHQGGASPYVKAAVEGELAEVAASISGSRNHTLNKASFALGQWVGGGELPEGEARDMLMHAALSCGLIADDGEHAVLKTIGSGVESGKREPRRIPAPSGDRRDGRDITADISDMSDSETGEPEESRILPPPPPVPLEAFPPSVAAMLEESAEAFTVPMQIPATCLLGVLSCLVGGTRLISLRPSWKEPGNIWIATVAASGIGKTPCAAAFFAPVKRLEYEAFRQWQDEYVDYENELELVRKERARAKRGEAMPDRPIQPQRRQAYVDDATVEALGEVLAENPRGIMWRKDELAGLIADLDKYSSNGGSSGGGTRSRLLSSFDGQEWKTSRASNPTRNLYIPHAYVGIFGGIQPAMLPKVFEAGGAGVDEASGFLQRFMLIRAEREKPGYWTERYLSHESKALLSSIAAALWSWDIEYDAEGREVERIVPVSRQAKAAFVEWFNGIAQEEFLSQNAALLSKLKGQAQRLCLLLHSLDAALAGNDGMGIVTGDCMRRALLLADWVKEHQEQCWRFFRPEEKAKQADPIERAIMQVVVDEAARIEADGWKISNERLFSLVESKLGMPGLSDRKLGKAVSGLGLTQCWMDKNKRARSVTAEKISSFRHNVGHVGHVGKPHVSTVSEVNIHVGDMSAHVGDTPAAYISPTSAYITPTCGEGLKDIGAQGPPTCPTCPTCDSEYLSEFDFNDPNFPDEVKI